MEVGLGVHGLRIGFTFNTTEEQCNLGYSGSTHEDSPFHSHEEHMVPGSVSSLPRGDSTFTWGTHFRSVGSGHQVPVGALRKATGSVWNIATF